MKQRLASLALILLLFALTLPAARAEADYFVYDTSGILTRGEWADIEILAAGISRLNNCGIYIVTVDDYRDYDVSVYEAAKTIYLGIDFGLGEARDGILLLLSMAERDYALVSYGDYGNMAFTDYGKDALSGVFLDDFRRDNWADGFRDYVSECGRYLELARAGTPVDVPETHLSLAGIVAISAVLSCVIAAVACSVMKSGMRTARQKAEAHDYLAGPIRLRVSNDRFINQTVERRPIEREERRSGGGGGTTVDSDGFSGTSGKF